MKADVVVLMATYNGEIYLREQIESLLAQKKVNVRIIVSDDGSTDGTRKILDEYKKKGKLEWSDGPQLGVERNFMRLIDNAPKADYYAFCDQDDVWEPEKLWVAIGKLKEMDDSKPALYYSSLKLVDQELRYISTHKINKRRSNYAKFIYAGIAGCTMVFNYSLLAKCKSAQPNFIRMHDIWVFDVCLAVGGKYYADVNSYINYRQHSNNTVGIKKKTLKELYCMYVINSKVEQHIKSLLECYGDEMLPEYRVFCEILSLCNTNLKKRLKLLFCKEINFNNLGLDLMFRLKTILKKM